MPKPLLEDDSVKIEVLRLSNDNLSSREIEEVTGVSRSSVLKFLNKKSYKDWWEQNDKPIAYGDLHDHHTNIKKMKNKRYLLTCAQNNTFAHKKFLKTLEVAKQRLDAEILVGTCSYNTNGFQNLEKGEGDWFDPLVVDYIRDEPIELAPGLIWFGELNILPTAILPLSGFNSYARENSGIIPHVKMQLESQPRNKDEDPRFLYSTGAVTQLNYIQKKAGQKASKDHIFGALLVEVDNDGTWFVRQINAESDTGNFYDLDTYYTPEGYTTGHRAEGVNWGDIHKELQDDDVYDISFGKRKDSILNFLKPKYQFIHDAIHFEARNHHNINDPYFRFQAFVQGRDSVQDNVRNVAEFLNFIDRDDCLTVVVESNHDQAMKRWLKEADYKNDPQNAIYFLENQLDLYKALECNDTEFSVFENAVRKFFQDGGNIVFLKEDQSFKIVDGIECGMHGHRGINGARGSVIAFTKLGGRYNTGHTHSAYIRGGVFCAGVSGELDQGYNVGPTTWSHSHIITYPNGKRTIITVRNGKYRVPVVDVTKGQLDLLI